MLKAIAELVGLCQDIYSTGIWPDDVLQSILIPLKKKTVQQLVKITELSASSHVLPKLCYSSSHTVQPRVETVEYLGEEQLR